jgi:hypothetical protein
MKARTQVILSDCIERGTTRGWALAHKHVENPTQEVILERIQNCVMSEIYDYFLFEPYEFYET